MFLIREKTTYNLQARGARVVTGRNMDDDGSHSNGSGKSNLVMAPLWALTGRSDARAEVWFCISIEEYMEPSGMHYMKLVCAQISALLVERDGP